MNEQDTIVAVQAAWQALSLQSLMPAVQERLAERSGRSLPRTARLALTQLSERGEMRISELAALTGVDISTMSRSLRHLDGAKLIRREPGDDLRAVVVSITEDGEETVARNRAAAYELVGAVLASWPEHDRELLAELLGRFARDFGTHLAASSGGRVPAEVRPS